MAFRESTNRSLVTLAFFAAILFAALGIRRYALGYPVAEHAVSAADLVLIVGVGILFVVAVEFGRRRTARPVDVMEQRAGFVMHTFQEVLRQLKDKEAELERLREQAVARAESVESYHRDILHSIASGVMTSDPSGRITTCNTAAEGILGRRAADFVGRMSGNFFAQSPLDEMIRVTLATREPISRREWYFDRDDGKRICVGLSSAPLRDRENQLIGAAVVFSDLSELKRLEAKVEDERRLAVLGEMSAGIAHEFRNYMGTILGWAKLLRKEHTSSAQTAQMVEGIVREVNAMERLIDDLLAFGSGNKPRPRRTSLRDLVSRSIVVSDSYRDVGLEIIWRDGSPEEVWWDDGLMQQVLKNLTQNALDAMLERGRLQITVSPVGQPDGAVRIEVADTGVGIPEDSIEKVFEPFFTMKAHGHGLGLSLVQKIVSAHGGRLTIHSTEGKGTTVCLTMPQRLHTHSHPSADLRQAA